MRTVLEMSAVEGAPETVPEVTGEQQQRVEKELATFSWPPPTKGVVEKPPEDRGSPASRRDPALQTEALSEGDVEPVKGPPKLNQSPVAWRILEQQGRWKRGVAEVQLLRARGALQLQLPPSNMFRH